MSEAGQGRLVQIDERNKNYPLPKLQTDRRHRYWSAGHVLDQGNTPQCVGYAGWGWLSGGPVCNKPSFTPTDLYHWAQDNDEWPGSNYEGSSTLGLMKALQSKGYIQGYQWATEAETLVAWILEKGPVVVGTDWFMDMANPDKHGFITPTGQNVGGHEWRIVGADRDKSCPNGTKGAVRMVNSWGTAWGEQGRAWVAINDLDNLIKNNGEAVTATEILRIS